MQLPRIKKLSNVLINRIAAGEVIERPASALKELLENSIDAKASKLIVSLIDGGIKQIKIIDNGLGVPQEDLPLALDRHATSKLVDEESLYNITTLGFRGEGLASIASVAKFSMSSKIETSEHGYKISSDFGVLSDVMPNAMNNGTIVEVNNLYHNIPARKKFLKSSTTEYGHCKNIFERISLSYPQINFELWHNDKIIYKLESQPLLKRISDLFGDNYTKNPCEILETQINGLNLSGYVYHPSYLSGNKTVQFFYINGRYVRDRVIQNAIKQGFFGVLHHEHQPQYILFLEIDPQEVDVNVHPTKSEVRFRDVGSIHSFISSSLRKVLASSHTTNDSSIAYTLPISDAQITQEPLSINIDKISPLVRSEPSFLYKANAIANKNTIAKWLPSVNNERISNKPEQIPNLFTNKGEISSDETSPKLGFALALLNGVYILSQTSEGLIVVDIHAAHERIILEKLKNQIANSNILSQRLLIPIVLDINEILMDSFMQYDTYLQSLGIECRSIDADKLEVLAIPKLINTSNIEGLILDTLGELSNYGNSNLLEEQSEAILSTIACHSAIRANDTLSLMQMNVILRDMEQTLRADYCNHGRPTWFKLSMQELDTMFMRGQ